MHNTTSPRVAVSLEGLSVLVVESDEVKRQQLGAWLEAEGLGVLSCPGPAAPDYSCVGTRGGECALAGAADVVVLDMCLESDLVMKGASAFDLLAYYRSMERPIVVLADAEDRVGLLAEPGIEVLTGPVQPDDLVPAMRRALAAGGDRARLRAASGEG
jgi:CheY-like chemotaxis protein